MKKATGFSVIGNINNPEKGCWIELTVHKPLVVKPKGFLPGLDDRKTIGIIHLDQHRIRRLVEALKEYIPD